MSTIVDTLVGLAILAAFLVVAAIGFIAAYFTPVILANAIRVQIDKLDWQIRRTHSKILIRVWYARWLIISLVTTALVAVYLMHIPSDRLTDTVLDIISRTPYGLILDLYRRIAGVSTTTNWFSQMFYIAIIWLLSNRLSARYNATNLFGDRMETEIVSDNSFNRRRLLRTFIYGTPLLVALSVAADWLNTHFPISLDFVKSAYKLFNENREDFKGILYCTVFAFLIGVAAAIILAVITGFLRRIIDGITGFLLVIAMGVALIVPAIVIDALGIADNAVVVITVLAAIVLIGNALLIEYQTMKESGESSSGPQFGVRGVYIKPSGYDIVTWLDSTPDSDN